ncbi:MAG: SdrD B-like domain-containing protein, partial [Leadbetterella sp.]
MVNFYKKALLSFATTLMVATSAISQITGTVYYDYNGNGTQQVSGAPAEVGIGGVTVRAFRADNTLAGSATTSSTGSYSIASITGNIRIEFVYPSYLYPSTGLAGNTTTRFINVSSTSANNNLGLWDPNATYGTIRPEVLVNCYVFGDQINGSFQNQPVLVNFPYISGDTVLNTTAVANYANPASHSFNVTAKQIGPTWGVAYHKTKRALYAGAYMKRHQGFGPGGAGAIYRIPYTTNPSPSVLTTLPTSATNPHSPTGSATNDWLKDFKTISGETRYVNTHDAVGKIGIGGLKVIENAGNPANDRLYAVNLYDRKVYIINPNTGAQVSSFDGYLSLPGASVGCAQSDVIPFGLGKRNGKLYIGIVCNAQSTATWTGSGNGSYNAGTGGNPGEPFRDNGAGGGTANDKIRNGGEEYKDIGIPNRAALRAYVYVYDPATSSLATSPATEFSLDYRRGCVGNGNIDELWANGSRGHRDCDSTGYRRARWNPWTPDFKTVGLNAPENRFIFPQPAVSDIEFTDAGSMVVTLWDRAGAQGGNETQSEFSTTSTVLYQGQTAGDILIASPTAGQTEKWTLESNGTSNGVTTGGANDERGTGGGQYFYQDAFPLFGGTATPFTNFTPAPNSQHNQVIIGGLSIVPGTNRVMAAVFDPVPVADNFEDQGVHYYDITGTKAGQLTRAYKLVDGSVEADGASAKDAGLGDIEAVSQLREVELGNRLWIDSDRDGVQDPGEAAIPNVAVYLYTTAGVLVGRDTTDANGFYLFNRSNVDTTGNSGSGGYSGLSYDRDYRIVVAPVDVTVTGGGSQNSNGGILTNGVRYERTIKDATVTNANDENDSDGEALPTGLSGSLNGLSGRTSVLARSGGPGGNKLNFDFGFSQALGSIGDTVFVDADRDGRQDAGETGLSGVSVVLRNSTGTPLDTVVTDANGRYVFTDLPAGTYSVRFIAPTNYNFTTANASGVPDDDDSDANASTGITANYTIDVTQPVGSSARDNRTVDAGFYLCTPPTPTPLNVQTGNNVFVCSGSQASLSASGCTNPYGYRWYSDAALTTVVSSTSSYTTPNITANTTYYVQCFLNTDCKSSGVAVTVNANPKPNAGANSAICAPATGTSLTGSPTGGSWSVQASPANPSAATINSSTGTVTGMANTGEYNFVYTVTTGGTACTDTVRVTKNAAPVANAGTDFTKTCTSNATGAAIGAAAVTGNTYAWSPATGLSSTTVSNPTANPTTTQTYTVTVTNTATGCTATDAVVVTVNTAVPTANAGTDFTKTCTSNTAGAAIGAAA